MDDYLSEIAEIVFQKVNKLPNKSQLSIAILQNGEVEFYGTIRDGEAIKRIDNKNSVFEIGSITKVFTSTVLTSLVEDKEVKLTDNINSFYPFDFKNNIKITFKSLANHTSGLASLPENLDLTDLTNPYKSYSKTEIEKYLTDLLKLDDKPLKSHAYSNLGMGLLGYTLGVSQRTTFQNLLKQKVFDKYGMNNTYTNSQNLEDQLVKGLDRKGHIVSNWDFDALFGAGGILSTTEDLVKFANAQFDFTNKELELTRKQTFEINENFRIGLGWHILKSKNGNDLFWHNGGTGGYSSSMTIDLKNKRAVIIVSNVENINKIIDELGLELIN